MSELEKETGDISVLHWLIYEHLVHNCYSETANSFSSSTQISNINNNSSTNSNEDVEMKDAKRLDTTINRPSSFNQASIASEDSKSLEDRKVIYHLVNSGNIKDAIEYCNSAFPNSLSGTTPESLYMCFLLHCQQFIEYIRIDSNEAFTFAQEELGRFAYMGEKFKSHLQDVISLIAYPDPKNSPQVSTFLSSVKREELANELNSYILAFQKLPSQTSIERIVRHLTVLQEQLEAESNKDKKILP
ncbi:hypothetical protein HK099_006967, partial [Clydaea vesicula]